MLRFMSFGILSIRLTDAEKILVRYNVFFLTILLSCFPFAPNQAGSGSEQYNAFLEADMLYNDKAWQDYVTAVGERVLVASPHRGRAYTFVLLDDPQVNAFTPGEGYIFLTRGLLSYLRSEDELAGVIGHEIGHNVAAHIQEGKGRARGGTVLGWIGLIATSSPAMLDLANTLSATASASYGRRAELEADRFSAQWLIKSGYNPQGMVDGIQVLRDNDAFETKVMGRQPVYHGIMRSHPEHQKRIHELVQLESLYSLDQLREPEEDYWHMLDGLVFGDQAATGVAKGNKFYHGALRVVIEFPEGWDTSLAGNAVLGQAPHPETATISVQRHQSATGGQTPETYVKETLKRDDVINGELIKIGESDAFVGDIKLADGSARKQKIGVVFRSGEVFLFRGELPDSEDLKAFDAKFRGAMAGLRAMTIDDLRVANSQRIKIVEAKPGDTFAKLSKGTGIGAHGDDLLRVINGLYPNGEPRAGDLIKVVQ